MSIRVSNLRLPVDEPEASLPAHLARALGVTPPDLSRWRIVRKALDLRDKRQLRFVYNFEVDLPADELEVVRRAADRPHSPAQVELHEEPPFAMPEPGHTPLPHRPVVVGSGPGGLVCAYFLAKHGYRPILLERGTKVNDRIRDVKAFDDGGEFHPESNYLFGEGGAGTFSDGKLTCRGTGPDVIRVLELLAECKGQQPGRPNILYYHRPHLGSNRLPAVVKALRQRIEDFGGEVRFLTRVEDIDFDAAGLKGVSTSSGFTPASVVVLAIGHSARDTYRMLAERRVPMAPKPFQFGVRIEHRQDVVNAVQFGPRHEQYEELLGNADYSLVASGKHDLFTFCMCAGGYIIPSVSQDGYFATNGMSLSKRDSPYANSGLVVTVPVEEFGGTDVLAGVRLQEKYEAKAFEIGRGREYRSPVQGARDFVRGTVSRSAPQSSYPRGVTPYDLREVLPPVVAEAVAHGLPQMDRRWHGRFLADAVLAGPESRGSSPVRIDRDNETRESPGVPGLYPVGEGAGYAGGIVSAAVDGLRTARAIIAKYAVT
ncbi:fad dependent oxidoreductase : FAD-dependent dehydrogenase OS=Singulisphaera acidiphila (strain ATCC BAA-1392 / DSM 18658 / VKM B-2454 / MOB10) GN=Sinac_3551 PE=4 SV=1: NAD_binding_8: DAO [Gemmataceae bacterium]|nr:fad dependent oxidoreductase : FAD-dependent dehydrogenase OS=Singulisphaera acidiphila (strain ATCC BAA-1392 / DSM 18658 / VKM B-2454 / MOB10) GN=Sinac_3551 PE=4 SV=1: NAD_binding_8: DAO [Gemmataceae bacterium]VTT97338.1 fad dependent oxidoreductase : FAD-dependent dehydrogenase OS=Singulisphaera acidiphila (strain ATCC BAA-1392 / DSM 18658 / VKM B-2454 / MOB10) GN=Sinac_3551 PE=4 SV=1: NAD_binding_8: DAO [Gemmataceae bacterium]